MLWKDAEGNLFSPPLVINGVAHHSPSSALLLEAGYIPYVPEKPVKSHVYKFDRYKVITALGATWGRWKDQLVSQGLYDAFMAAPYLSTGDPLFLQVWSKLSKEERLQLIKECRYGRY